MSFLAVVGVRAERCSNSLVSQRSQMDWREGLAVLDMILEDKIEDKQERAMYCNRK